MKLTRSSADTAPGPADWFTGEVVTWLEHVTDEDYAAQG